MSLRQRGAQRQRDVVREDDAEAEDEASQLAVAAIGGAEREADDAEHETGDRDRELLMDRHDLVGGGRAIGGGAAGNRHQRQETQNSLHRSTPCFSEVIIAPEFEAEARSLLQMKKNLRLIRLITSAAQARSTIDIRSVSGGVLVQELTQFRKRPLLAALRAKLPGMTVTDLKFRSGAW